MYPVLIKRLLQHVFQLFVIVSGFLWLPYCGNDIKAAHTRHFNRWVLWVYGNPSFFVNWFFSKLETRANFLVSSYLYRWWQQALGLPSKLYWSWFMFSRFLFSREDGPHYSDLKLSTWTMRILVCLGTDFLWKFDGVYRHWNAFCVNRWHSNRYYTLNQGTEKRRDTKLKLSTWTMGILVSWGTDFLWKFDRVYRCWNAFCVNRWHSNRYYTINQGT